MPWVKAEYAGELAVVSAWIAALVPWSLSVQPAGPFGSLLFMVRWPLVELQVRLPASLSADGEPLDVAAGLAQVYPGVNLFGSFYVTEPVSAATFYQSPTIRYGGYAWLAVADSSR